MDREQFRIWSALLSDAVLLTSRDGRILEASAGVRKFGLQPDPLSGNSLFGLTVNSEEDLRDFLRRCSRTRQPIMTTLTIRGADAQELECRCDGMLAHHDPEGTNTTLLLKIAPKASTVAQFRLINEKIDDLNAEIQRRAAVERDLQQKNEALSVTLSSIGDGVIVTDAEFNVTRLNPVAEELTGWSNDEAIGRPLDQVFRIINEHSREPVENPATRALRDGVIVGLANHTILIARDGTERPVEDSAAPIRNGDVTVGVILIFRDVTQRQLDARRIHESEQRLRAATEAANVGTWRVDLETMLDTRDANLNRMFGLEPRETTQPVDDFLNRIDARDRPTVERLIHESIEQLTSYEVECRIMRPDGKERWIRDTGNVMCDATGKPVVFTGAVVDITEQRRLLEQRETYASLVQNSPDFIAVYDLALRPYFINQAGLRTVGLDGLQQVRTADIADFFYPEDRDAFHTRFLPQVRADGHAELEIRMRHFLTGEPIWMLYNLIQLNNALDEPVGYAAVSRNITERKRAERRLSASERRFHELADSMPQVVWTAQPDGTVDYLNARWYEFSQTARTSDETGDWLTLIHPSELPRVAEQWRKAVADGSSFEVEARFRNVTAGGYRWMLVRAVPVKEDGKLSRWFGTCTDIDQRKRSDEAHRFISDASAVLTQITDMDSTLQRLAGIAVPQFSDWCAIDVLNGSGDIQRRAISHSEPEKVILADDLVRRHPMRTTDDVGIDRVIRTGHPELVADIDDALLEKLAHDPEHLQTLKDLGLRSYVCVPLSIQGSVAGAITFVTAESQRQYDSVALQAATEVAYRAGIAIENAQLYDQLRVADQRKDEFLATLAHELRNPLAPIRTGLEVMKLAQNDAATIEQIRGTMERQTMQLVRLIDDLMDVSRITRGKFELRKGRIELAAVVRSAVEAVGPFIDEQGHELIQTIPDEPIMLDGDPNRLAQVIANLLNNAAKYTRENGRIWLTVQTLPNHHVEIAVRDTGSGIPVEMRDHIFEMFTQIDRSLERAHAGLGIGLTLVKSLVTMHGGTVQVFSDGENKGSNFVVTLPTLNEQPEQPQRTGGRTVKFKSHCRVLVVDDNRAAADSLRTMLTILGHEVETAHDGLEGLAVAESYRPDLVLLDLGMPRLNGFDTASRLRAQPWGKNIAIVAVTGWGQQHDRNRTKAAGFDDHLVKPVEPDVVRKLIDELMLAPDGDSESSRPELS